MINHEREQGDQRKRGNKHERGPGVTLQLSFLFGLPSFRLAALDFSLPRLLCAPLAVECFLLWVRLARLEPRFPCLVAKMIHGCQDGCFQPNVKVAPLEAWQQALLSYLRGIGIREVRRQAFGDSERVSPFIGGPQQHNAIVSSGFTYLPEISNARRVVSGRESVETIDHHHHKFDGSFPL